MLSVSLNNTLKKIEEEIVLKFDKGDDISKPDDVVIDIWREKLNVDMSMQKPCPWSNLPGPG